MHLKSIEMVGFKSFADKTYIELKPGISGIVGPNGCGKSNIVDALRWCLGEMSAKSLRSKHMLDVIFAGASGRAPMNLAEVTLTFDNTHHLLPLDFTEIQVTRRLFRSGESEYFLNRAQCRLKDLRDLFMDTGLHEGYSILAQGEVDFVINAKPEERRELFEEAAGISKYKARREEALRKLEKVEIDLSRLNDLISVIKEQMDSLEAAARKAKLFQKAKEDLKSLEITDALHKMVALDGEIAAAQKKMEELRNDYEKATASLDLAQAHLTQYHLDQDRTEKELYDKNVAILELDKQLNASDNLIRSEKEREKELLDQAVKLEEKIETLAREKSELEAHCVQARGEIETAAERLKELQAAFNSDKSSWEALREERKKLEQEKARISEIVFSLTADSSGAANEKNRLSAFKIHKESDVASVIREIEKSRQENARLTQELEILKTQQAQLAQSKESIKTGVDAARKDWAETQEKEESLRNQIQSLRIALAHSQAQDQILRKKFEKDPYHKGTQSILSQGFPGLHGVVGVLFKYQAHVSHWVESVLGPKIHYLVFDRQDQAQEALSWLKEHSLGRARCIVLEKIPDTLLPDLSAISNANSLMAFVQCDPAEEKLKKYLFGQAFLAGNTLYETGVIDGGSDLSAPASDENSAASFQNEFLALKNLEDEIASNKNLLKAMEEESFIHGANLSHLKSALQEKETELGRISLQDSHLSELCSRKAEELDIASRERTLLEHNQAALVEELSEISSQVEACNEKINLVNAELAKREAERTTLLELMEASRNEEQAREVAAKESEVRLESFNREYEKSESALRDWETRLARSVKESEESRASIQEGREKAQASRARQEEAALNIVKFQEEKTRLTAQAEELLQAKSERENKNREFLAELEKTRERQMEVTQTLHQADLDLKGFESEKRNILARMEETYQVNREQIELNFKPEPVQAEEIARLKKRVESMSNSVNLEAPEQHAALSERFNFLSAQTQDLQKAREDLKSAIHQINATTREQFRETFAKVREHFQKIYGTLFQGGSADLVFTDEQNILETGIDIVAQPPGKKLQSIALLSGGEKALTAMSLLFAFFMVKPSPFCVMDEVDAPWDLSNVARFVNLVKEFSNKIQFLVVTHNSRTMEIADILYGVTMQEFGISKILSTRLKKQSAETEPAAPEEELAPA